MGTRALRAGYLAFGLLCVGLGFIGTVVPVMPSTVFFIVALWAFKRSSPPLEAWLLARSPALRDWDRERSITLRTKRLAISMVWVGIGISIAVLVHKRWTEWTAVFAGESPSRHAVLIVPILLLMVAISLTWFLATRKTKQTAT